MVGVKEAAAVCVPKSGVGGWRFVCGEAITIDKLPGSIAGSITLMNLILSVAGPLESATWFRARLAHLLGAGPPSPLSLHPNR